MTTSHSSPSRLCLIGEDITKDEQLKQLIRESKLDIIECQTTLDDEVKQCDEMTLFVLRDFEGDDFAHLSSSDRFIIGVTALRQHLARNMPLPLPKRPLHNLAMKDLLVCFARTGDMGDDAKVYLDKLRFMGAFSRKDMSAKISHLIASKPKGEKYKKAVSFGVTIMKKEWIDYAWEQRFNTDFDAAMVNVIERFDLKPFTGLEFGFVNFQKDDLTEIEDLTHRNGGKVISPTDPNCTHIIVDAIPGRKDIDFDFSLVPDLKHKHVVTREWFWACVEINGKADEEKDDYAFPVEGCRTYSLKHGGSRMSLDILSPGGHSLDFSTSFIDSPKTPANEIKKPFELNKKATKRRYICHELLTTDRNYLNVLRTIVEVFQKPLETMGATNHLDATEMKIIFGNLGPLIEIHEKLVEQLEKVVEHSWKENASIGQVFTDNVPGMLKAYQPFVNFFENTKQMIEECDTKYPRFHAFIKKCESKPECHRETLTQMLIRPVQRLPSVQLLLKDILKATDKCNPDFVKLEQAISKISEILLCVNEGKRVTEGQLAMFDLIHDIKDCPASLLSAHRKFICRVDAKLLQQDDDKSVYALRGQTLTLFLFTDVLEICKKKTVKRSDSIQSKGSAKGGANSTSKSSKPSYKHIELIELKGIRTIYHFDDLADDLGNSVIFESGQTTERYFKIYPFLLDCRNDQERLAFIQKLGNQLGQENVMDRTDLKKLQTLDYSYAENLAALLFQKSRLEIAKSKISRAFSMTKRNSMSTTLLPPNSREFTPPPSHIPKGPNTTPRRMSRFSSILHPLRSSVASPLSRKQISVSSLSINQADLGNVTESEPDVMNGTFSLPTTPAPRKKKCPDSQSIYCDSDA
ncbi:Protein ECT2 [Halotydeus destructor]|nr:Protein ECT2 [Halotydeus destructor]